MITASMSVASRTKFMGFCRMGRVHYCDSYVLAQLYTSGVVVFDMITQARIDSIIMTIECGINKKTRIREIFYLNK